MNWSNISGTIYKEIKNLGMTIKIVHANGGNTITKGIWSSSNQHDANNKSVSMLTQNDKIIYIPAIKKEPTIGDILIVNAIEYSINTVDKYCPTNIVLAYKLTVSN